MKNGTVTGSGKVKKPRKERIVNCGFCNATFKKLEHLQRHERTHTQDRPYRCEICQKTFARQDTLHRHTKLHDRKDDIVAPSKPQKKRRVSSASSYEASPSPREPSASLPSSGSSPLIQQAPQLLDLDFPIDIAVAPTSFPTYSQPDLPSLDSTSFAFPRRLSDVSYGTTLPTRLDADRSASFTGNSTGTPVGTEGTGLSSSAKLGARPRALTLAGLPESLGCFSLVNSPTPTNGGESSSGSEAGDSDELRPGSSSSDGEDRTGGIDWIASFAAPPESHYPSPAFSCYSPSALAADPLFDLKGMLSAPLNPSSYQQPTSTARPEPDFDYKKFAASIEGPVPARRFFSMASVSPAAEAPTLAAPQPASLTSAIDEFSAQLSAADAEQQAREAAATAAMLGGFGCSLVSTQLDLPAPSTSALGLDFGLQAAEPSFFPPVSKYYPQPPPLHGLAISTASSTSSIPIQPTQSLPLPPQPFSTASPTSQTALSTTFTTSYPSFDYPMVGFDLPNSTSSTSMTSPPTLHATQVSTSAASAHSKPPAMNFHDLLTAAWEKRQQMPAGSVVSPAQPATTAIRQPVKPMAAFYIPS
ncbi:hypothetical protein JCM11641_000937 [Rhodosporidiobolus odoratus]